MRLPNSRDRTEAIFGGRIANNALASSAALGERPAMKHQRIAAPELSRTPSPTWLVAAPFFAVGVLFSIWYLDAYYMGDAIFYTRFYDSLYGMPLEHWANLQLTHLSSTEPLYRLVLGLGAYIGWDRISYLSVWNGVFTGAIGYALVKYRCSPLFSLFVLTNFYFLVLLGPAERLKFAYIMLILAFVVETRWLKFALAVSSPFFHTQAIVQFVSGLGYYLFSNLRTFARTPGRALLLAALGGAALVGISYLFLGLVGQSIENKSADYAEASGGLVEGIQWGLLLAAGLYVFKGKPAYFVAMLPMGPLTVLFGNRVNVATFALFASLAILQRKTSNPIVLAVMGYMSIKSVPFLLDVVQYGDGFVGG